MKGASLNVQATLGDLLMALQSERAMALALFAGCAYNFSILSSVLSWQAYCGVPDQSAH